MGIFAVDPEGSYLKPLRLRFQTITYFWEKKIAGGAGS
jgi:hypothetical protein